MSRNARMVIVEVTDRQMLRAAELQREIFGKDNIRRTPNYTGIYAPDRFQTGYLGEFAVANWLEQNGAIFLHRVRPSGKREKPELHVDIQCRTEYVEVKCAGDARTTNFRHNEKQGFEGLIEIGVKLLDLPKIGLMGWLYATEVRALPIIEGPKGPANTCKYTMMRDLADLVPLLYPTFHVKPLQHPDSLELL